MRANPIIAFIVKEGTLDHFGAGDTGGSSQCATGRTFCVGLTLKRTVERLPRRRGGFSSYFPRPNATLFVITRPLIHNAMSILVPDRWIFDGVLAPPTEDELTRYYYLNDDDLTQIMSCRGEQTRFGFALQLTTVRYLGTFLDDPVAVPSWVLETLSRQLGLANR